MAGSPCGPEPRPEASPRTGAPRETPSRDPQRAPSGLKRLRAIPWVARAEISLAAFAIWLLLRTLRITVRVQTYGAAELERHWSDRRPVLMAFWHGRSLMLPFFYAGRGACIMNSSHRDGEIITRALARFGIASTRGSSTRGGVAGLLGMVRAQRRGLDLALIPDGPRGPAGVAKAGVVQLAIVSKAPIFPMAMGCSHPIRLKTWDRMMLPRPFSRVVLAVGEPLSADWEAVPGETRSDKRERLRAELERRLKRAAAEADRVAGAVRIEET